MASARLPAFGDDSGSVPSAAGAPEGVSPSASAGRKVIIPGPLPSKACVRSNSTPLASSAGAVG